MTFGKLKPRLRANKVSGAAEATWRFCISSAVDRIRLKELWRTQLQHFSTLLEAVESHPNFHKDWQPGLLLPVGKAVTYVSAPEVQPAA